MKERRKEENETESPGSNGRIATTGFFKFFRLFLSSMTFQLNVGEGFKTAFIVGCGLFK